MIFISVASPPPVPLSQERGGSYIIYYLKPLPLGVGVGERNGNNCIFVYKYNLIVPAFKTLCLKTRNTQKLR